MVALFLLFRVCNNTSFSIFIRLSTVEQNPNKAEHFEVSNVATCTRILRVSA